MTMKKFGKWFGVSAGLLAAFALWTIVVCNVDVQVIGPEGSCVGLATINRYVHGLTGVHFSLYIITDWLGLIPVGVCMGFGAFGLVQWIGRRSLLKVDGSILALGGFYVLVIAAYALFEKLAVNYRPVLIDGRLEASYPSSTTVLVMCVMPTAVVQLNDRLKSRALKRWTAAFGYAFVAFMVIARLVSGVHWFSDIVGGALLSAGLVSLYRAGAFLLDRRSQVCYIRKKRTEEET